LEKSEEMMLRICAVSSVIGPEEVADGLDFLELYEEERKSIYKHTVECRCKDTNLVHQCRKEILEPESIYEGLACGRACHTRGSVVERFDRS
jgi:hypothetical protein